SFTFETVSTQCFGACGLCDAVGSTTPGFATCTTGLHTSEQNLMAQTDAMTITYYPYPFFNGNATDLNTRISNDFGGMTFVSAAVNRNWIIQEAGYPTSGSPTPGATQRQFVNSLFAAWAANSNSVVAL